MAKRPAKKTKAKAKAAPKTAKPAAKKSGAKKPVASKPAAPKRAALKPKPRKTLTVVVPQSIRLDLPSVLHDRLKGLSQVMGLPMEGVMRQALTEFADTWEEHHRTVASLADTGDRMMLVVGEE